MLIVFIAFIIFLIVGMPIAFAVGISGALFFVQHSNLPATIMVQMPLTQAQNFALLAVPLFIFAGNLLNCGGTTDRLAKFAGKMCIRDRSEYAVYNAVLDLIYASSYRNKYVDSIYLYFEDGERYFISSKKRLTNLDEYEDTQWYEDYLSSDPFVGTWASMRQVNTADGESRRFLTIYHRIFAGGTGSDRGVLVLNIDQSYMNELLDSLNAVSYTHLDVYKRQVYTDMISPWG